MSLIPLQYVLLFAIAISQIFGGISCCCLGRTLFGSAAVAAGGAIRDLTGETSSADTFKPIGKCPKCSARKSDRPASKNTSATQATSCPAISDDGQCQCQKLNINASTSNELVTVDRETLAWSVPILDSAPNREVVALDLRKFEVPIRFGGRSWQSVACVWMN